MGQRDKLVTVLHRDRVIPQNEKGKQMKTQDENPGMFEDYFGFDIKTLFVFGGLVVAVIVIVTVLYISIFGFQNWKSNMNQASALLLSNFNAGAPLVEGQPLLQGATPNIRPVIQGTGQYTCPTCGTIGLPSWSANGAPLCPNCGNVMGLSGQVSVPAKLAAAP